MEKAFEKAKCLIYDNENVSSFSNGLTAFKERDTRINLILFLRFETTFRKFLTFQTMANAMGLSNFHFRHFQRGSFCRLTGLTRGKDRQWLIDFTLIPLLRYFLPLSLSFPSHDFFYSYIHMFSFLPILLPSIPFSFFLVRINLTMVLMSL